MSWSGSVEVTTAIPAAASAVWARAILPSGINHELGPWLRMTVPRKLNGLTVEDAPRGVKLGRSWVLFLRIIPVDYDDLCLMEVGPGFRFLERSQLGSMKLWQHERVVTNEGTGASVTDRLTFEPRLLLGVLPGSEKVATALVRRIFQHRQRRLRAHFSP